MTELTATENHTDHNHSHVPIGSAQAGELLRRAREKAGVQLEVLASALKVSPAKLHALETGDHASMLDSVFARGLASSVCRSLKVDATPVLALLPNNFPTRLEAENKGLNASYKAGAGPAAAPLGLSTPMRPIGLLIVVLLVGAVALMLMPRDWFQSADDGSSAVVAATPLHASPEAVAASAGNTGHATSAPAAEATQQASSQTLEGGNAPLTAAGLPHDSAAAPAAVAALAAESPAGTAAALSPDAAAQAAAKANVVAFYAHGETWVQIRDTQNRVVLSRLLKEAESVGVNAPLPLSVVVGRADVTDIFVRGAALEVASVARNNVARFEVK